MMEEGAKRLEGVGSVSVNAPLHSLSLMHLPLLKADLLSARQSREGHGNGRHWSLGWSQGAGMRAGAQKRWLS